MSGCSVYIFLFCYGSEIVIGILVCNGNLYNARDPKSGLGLTKLILIILYVSVFLMNKQHKCVASISFRECWLALKRIVVFVPSSTAIHRPYSSLMPSELHGVKIKFRVGPNTSVDNSSIRSCNTPFSCLISFSVDYFVLSNLR